MKPTITVALTKFTAAATLDSLGKLRAWVDAGIDHVHWIHTKTPGEAGRALAETLDEPYRQLQSRLSRLDTENSTRADVAAFWKQAKPVIAGISNGASIGPNSQISTALKNLSSTWSVMGFLVAVTGIHADVTHRASASAGDEQIRKELASGIAYATYLGLLRTDPEPLELNALRAATKEVSSLAERIERIRDRNQTAATEWEEDREYAASATDERVSGLIEAQVTKLDKLYKDHVDRMTVIQQNFKQRLVLSGPSDYWKERAKATFWSAARALGAFIALVAGFIYVASTMGPEHVEQVLEAIQPMTAAIEGAEIEAPPLAPGVGSTLLGFALVTTPAIMALWVLMLISRVFRENFHLSNDAHHRHMLITTYQALAEDEDNPVDPEDRKYALAAIFSVPTEASADDALTAMGNVVRGGGR